LRGGTSIVGVYPSTTFLGLQADDRREYLRFGSCRKSGGVLLLQKSLLFARPLSMSCDPVRQHASPLKGPRAFKVRCQGEFCTSENTTSRGQIPSSRVFPQGNKSAHARPSDRPRPRELFFSTCRAATCPLSLMSETDPELERLGAQCAGRPLSRFGYLVDGRLGL
jgi:hypothetical protein